MKRHVDGLHEADCSSASAFPDGLFLVRVRRVQYRREGQNPYYTLQLEVIEPKALAGQAFTGRLYCTPKALWKLNWFLRDFGYDRELLGQDEIDERLLVGLSGVVKIRHVFVHGTSLLNLDGFAPASQWDEQSCGITPDRISPSSADPDPGLA